MLTKRARPTGTPSARALSPLSPAFARACCPVLCLTARPRSSVPPSPLRHATPAGILGRDLRARHACPSSTPAAFLTRPAPPWAPHSPSTPPPPRNPGHRATSCSAIAPTSRGAPPPQFPTARVTPAALPSPPAPPEVAASDQRVQKPRGVLLRRLRDLPPPRRRTTSPVASLRGITGQF